MERLKRIKVIKILIILITTLYLQDSFCQLKSKFISLTIIDQKRSYHKNDTVKFKFQNLSGKKLWFVVGFEILDEGKWREVFYDLDNPLNGVEKIYSINKQKDLYFLVNKVPFTGPKSSPYRLFIMFSFNHRLLNFKKEELNQFVFLQ